MLVGRIGGGLLFESSEEDDDEDDDEDVDATEIGDAGGSIVESSVSVSFSVSVSSCTIWAPSIISCS